MRLLSRALDNPGGLGWWCRFEVRRKSGRGPGRVRSDGKRRKRLLSNRSLRSSRRRVGLEMSSRLGEDISI